MHLKSFSTYGFKSFADKIELSFGSGITAIVGPNGSGKSNISDAIRWVLGEQSAKYLRGSKMEDVIFSGSGKRRPLGVAEVTLVFDNSDHRLSLDFDEVSITRRVFRSGDSEYSINKKNCRLKDILDLLADTGLGRGSMSIIGQNKIDEILNSRPEERRALFEEAAGIAKFRMRKKEAMRRLDDTAANLTRINDIKAEVEGQVEPLRLAAEQTRKFNLLDKELRACKLTQFVHKIENIENIRQKLNTQDAELENKVLERATAVSTQEAECSALQMELDKLSEAYNRIQDDIKEKETALEKLRGQEAVLAERVRQSEKSGLRLEEQGKKLQEQIAALDTQLKTMVVDYDRLEAQQAAAQLLVSRLTGEQAEKETRISEAEAAMEDMKTAAFDNMRTMVNLRNEIRGLEQEQEQRMRKRDALKKSIAEAETAGEELQTRYRNMNDEQSNVENSLELIKRDGREVSAKAAEETEALNKVLSQHKDCQNRITALESRLNLLQNMQKSYEGFGYGIKTVLQSQEPWRSDVIGVAAELIEVQPEYVVAIETALGGAAQNLVMGSSEAAKKAIAYLKQRQAGRATFLPLDTIKYYERRSEEEALAKLPGIRGFAADLIGYDIKLAPIFKFLLGRVLVADNMDAALAAAKKSSFRTRVVTLAGDVVNAGGSLTGGSRQQKEAGFLSRGKEIDEQEQKAGVLRRELLGYQELLEEHEGTLKVYNNKLVELRQDLQQKEIRKAELGVALERLSAEQRQAAERLELLLDDRNQVSQEYMAARQQLTDLRPQLTALEAEDAQGKQLLDDLQKQTVADHSALASIRNRLQDARVELESTAARTTMMAERMQQLDADMGRMQQELAANEDEQKHLLDVITASKTSTEQLAASSTALLAELQTVVGGKDEFGAKRIAITEKQAVAGERLDSLKKELTVAETRRNQAAMEMVRQNSDYDHALEQLATEYRITLDEARASGDLLDESDAALRRRELRLEREIETLGPVNPAAIEQYEAVSERYEFLQRQYSDLSEAKANLEAVISEINSGMAKRFKEAFGKINEYFSDCYVRLFGGGTAALKLTDPNDVLGSGIDIEVQPPGKKLQSLFLLSGGERALTVIALLFALLSYQPSPFCILDEIDAALDEANVDRFAKFLAAYAESTQFIVITHRKGTMEAAHVLHGVTMEESGVSKLLSVKLSEKE